MRFVVRADEPLDPPRVGEVLGWEDEDRALVLWGDAIGSGDPDRARVEYRTHLTEVTGPLPR